MKLKKHVIAMVLVLFFLIATYVLYDYKITLEEKIENAFNELYQTGDTHAFFDDDHKRVLMEYFDTLKASGLIGSTFSAYNASGSETVYVLIKSNYKDEESVGIGYLIFDVDDHNQVNNLVISSWVRVASDKDNF